MKWRPQIMCDDRRHSHVFDHLPLDVNETVLLLRRTANISRARNELSIGLMQSTVPNVQRIATRSIFSLISNRSRECRTHRGARLALAARSNIAESIQSIKVGIERDSRKIKSKWFFNAFMECNGLGVTYAFASPYSHSTRRRPQHFQSKSCTHAAVHRIIRYPNIVATCVPYIPGKTRSEFLRHRIFHSFVCETVFPLDSSLASHGFRFRLGERTQGKCWFGFVLGKIIVNDICATPVDRFISRLSGIWHTKYRTWNLLVHLLRRRRADVPKAWLIDFFP